MKSAVRAVIVAFDDVLAHTRTVRADAIMRAAASHGLALDAVGVTRATTGLALPELVHALVANEPRARTDPTLVELVVLAAARLTTQAMSYGGAHRVHDVHIDTDVRARCTAYVAHGTRVLLRTDSTRRDVDTLLQLAGLDALPVVAICADDRLDGAASESVALRAWRTIDRRLTALGISRSARLAVEATPELAEIASAFVGSTDAWSSQ